MRYLIYCLIFLFLLPLITFAQQPVGVRITGRIIFEDATNQYTRVKIYNKRTITYVVPKETGTFELVGYKQDTFIFVCQNYTTYYLSYKDSARQMSYETDVTLHRLEMNISGVTITPDKSFEQIQEAIDNLGVENTNTYKSVSAYPNTISALYELFSKTEKAKRTVAKLMNDDERRQAMRDLLKLCIKSDMIDLSFSEMDAFIDFCGYTDDYLQQVSLYDLLSDIKLRYKYYRRQ